MHLSKNNMLSTNDVTCQVYISDMEETRISDLRIHVFGIFLAVILVLKSLS